jgi:VanZ family protein
VTLWPFNPFPRNGVQWSQGTSGILFESDGVVVSSSPLLLPQHDVESYTLELLLRPAAVTTSQTILVFYSPGRSQQLVLRQYLNGLVVTHDDSIYNDSTRRITFYVDKVFRPAGVVHVTVSSGPNGTVVYLDGRVANHNPGFTIERTDLSGEIILGGAPVACNTWRGELRGVAIYSKELTEADVLHHYQDWMAQSVDPDLANALALYNFDARAGREVRNEIPSGPNLKIPETFFVPHKEFLRSPVSEFRPTRGYAIDLLPNIAGFIPLGMVVCAYFVWSTSSRRAIMITTLACGLLSLAIEILQYYVPRRGSGMTDILTNSVGALIGAMLLNVGIVRRALEQLKLVPRT